MDRSEFKSIGVAIKSPFFDFNILSQKYSGITNNRLTGLPNCRIDWVCVPAW